MNDDHEKKRPIVSEMPNPWNNFFNARLKAILWLQKERGFNNEEIAWTMSIDENQVSNILKSGKELDDEEEIGKGVKE